MSRVESREDVASFTESVKDIFPFLTTAEIGTLLRYLDPRDWKAGDVLIEDGDEGKFMGFLVDGKIAVKKETIFPGKFILIAVLERGSMVGEISSLGFASRNATVVAAEDSRLLVLTAESMEKLLVEDAPLGIKLLRRIIHVLGIRLRSASERLADLL